MTGTELTAETDGQSITLTRTFDAPRERVFETWTDPERIPEWWGPGRYDTAVDEMAVRPGGRWRFVDRDDEGAEYGFHGVYHDVVAPERIVQTFEFEGTPGQVSLETATFEEVADGTRVTVRSVFPSVEAIDASMDEGMEDGARETWERLAELVERQDHGTEEEVDA